LRGTRFHLDDADFADIAGFIAANEERTAQDVDAKTFAGAAFELALDRPGVVAIDAFVVLGLKIDALKTRITLTIPSVSSPAWWVTASMVMSYRPLPQAGLSSLLK